MKRAKIIIYGDVQGKFFRAAIQEKALMLDLCGYVKNNDDGSVTAVLEGDETDIDEMVEFCKEGPRGASVDDVEVVDQDYKGDFDDFEIRY
ncbi:MAG: acylphosphatase [Candidatus Nanoarchaeia archaeon]|nr:acylphosphatase [Candidatus Nanoarchaeia archaeon]